MGGELETVVRVMFDALDRNDPEAGIALAAEEGQGIDELSRRWPCVPRVVIGQDRRRGELAPGLSAQRRERRALDTVAGRRTYSRPHRE